jgi:hypothetical protein
LRVRLSDFARFSRAASDRCFGESTRAMATPLRTYNMTGTHKRLSTKTPGVIQVHHEAELDKNFGLCAPTFVPCLPFFCWDKYNERAFIRVTENELVTNYPFMCLPFLIPDCIKTQNWQGTMTEFVPAKNCTPMHTCCFVELCGGVAATSVHPACNSMGGRCCFPCLSCYVIGLKDAESFCAAANAARDAHIAKLKTDSAPSAQRM